MNIVISPCISRAEMTTLAYGLLKQTKLPHKIYGRVLTIFVKCIAND